MALRAGIEAGGLEAVRADDVYEPRAVLEKILRGIGEAEVIVADLSKRNANVFYELGISHTEKQNVVLVAQDIDDIPVDLRPFEYVIYDDSEVGLEELGERLAAVIRGIPSEPPSRSEATLEELTVGYVRRTVRSVLRSCEGIWGQLAANGIRETKEFYSRQLTSEDRDAIASNWQSGFLQPWQPIEALGLRIIDDSLDDPFLQMLEAIETAYSFEITPGFPQQITGQQPGLIAYRTWAIWGALAVDRNEWNLVEALLTRPLRLDGYLEQGVKAVPTHTKFFHPEATLGYSDSAARSIYDVTESPIADLFVGIPHFQSAVGAFLFAAMVARFSIDPDARQMVALWTFSPIREFNTFSQRLEKDPVLADSFASAVGAETTSDLNQKWGNYLSTQLAEMASKTSDFFPEHRLPQRFAQR